MVKKVTRFFTRYVVPFAIACLVAFWLMIRMPDIVKALGSLGDLVKLGLRPVDAFLLVFTIGGTCLGYKIWITVEEIERRYEFMMKDIESNSFETVRRLRRMMNDD